MVMPGETIATGASSRCSECGDPLPLKVLQSPAGHYIGTFCDKDGPHSRESGYYYTREKAQAALDQNTFSR